MGNASVVAYDQHCSTCPPRYIAHDGSAWTPPECLYGWMPEAACVPGPGTLPPMSPNSGGLDPMAVLGGEGDPITYACQTTCWYWDLPYPIPLVVAGPIVQATGAGDCPPAYCGNGGNAVTVKLPWIDEDSNGVHDFEDQPGLAGPPKSADEILEDLGFEPGTSFDPNNPDHLEAMKGYLEANPFGDPDGDGIPNLTDNFPVGSGEFPAGGGSLFAFGGIMDLPSGLNGPGEQQQFLQDFMDATGFDYPGGVGGDASGLLPNFDGLDMNGDGVIWMTEAAASMLGVLNDKDSIDGFLNSFDEGPERVEAMFQLESLSAASQFMGVRSGLLDVATALKVIGRLNARNELYHRLEIAAHETNTLVESIEMGGSATLEYLPDSRGTKRFMVVYRDVTGAIQDFEEAFKEFVREALLAISTEGDPVATANGAFLMKEIDYALPGRGLGFSFERHYSSKSSRKGILGWKWSVPLLETRMLLHRPEGSTSMADAEAYVAWGDGTWGEFGYDVPTETFVGKNGEFSKIREYSSILNRPCDDCSDDDRRDLGFTLRNPNGIQYHFCPPSAIEGLGPFLVCFLRKVVDQDGNSLTFRRSRTGLVTEVIDTMGRVTQFYYTDGNLLESIIDHKGDVYLFGYDTDREELLMVQGPKVHYLDVVSQEMKFDNYYQMYDYNQPLPGWDENQDPSANHNIEAVYRSSNLASAEIEYYPSNGSYEANRVKRTVESGRATSFEYEQYLTDLVGPNIPDLAEEIRHRAKTVSSEGVVSEFYHDKVGQLVWKVIHNDRADTTGVIIPGSGEPTDPDQWWSIRQYNSQNQLLMELETTSTLYPGGQKVELEYDWASPDRFQNNNMVKMTTYPDVSAGGGSSPRAYEVIYDPITAQPYKEIDPEGGTTIFHRGHHELTYGQAQILPLVVEWGLLQEPSAVVPEMWDRTELDGDGILGGTHQVIEKIYPTLTSNVPVAPGEVSPVPFVHELWRYNSVGAVVWNQGISGAVMETEYVGGYPVIERFDANGHAVENHYTFGTDGQMLTKRDPMGLMTVSTYNERGLLVKTTIVSEEEMAHENCKIQDSGTKKCKVEHGMIQHKYRDLYGNIVATVGPMSGLEPDVTVAPNFSELDTVVRFNAYGETEFVDTQIHNLSNQANTTATWNIKERGDHGQIKTVVDPRGALREYEHNSRGSVVRVYRAESEQDLRILQQSVELAWHGAVAAYERPLLNTASEAHRFTFGYDDFWRRSSSSGPQGWNTITDYNVNDTVDKYSVYQGADFVASDEYQYDSWGQLAETKRTTSVLNSDGTVSLLLSVPDRSITRFGYTPIPGRIAWKSELSGLDSELEERKTRYVYDLLGRVKSEHVMTSDGELSVYRNHDDVGRMLEERKVLDSRGETGVNSPSEVITTFVYDAYGNRSSIEYPDGSSDKTVHDERGFPYFCFRSDGTRSLYSRDSVGQILKRTDATSSGTRDYLYEYDFEGNVTAFTEPSGAFSEFEYDAYGRLETKSVGVGTTSEFESAYTYKDSGLPESILTDDGLLRLFEYDVFGALEIESATDSTGSRTAASVSYLRNAMGDVREAKLSMPGVPDSFVRYDRLSIGGTTARTVSDTHGTHTYTQAYDELGNVIEQVYPSGWTLTRAYDEIGRPESVSIGSSTTPSVEFFEHYGAALYRRMDLLGTTVVSTEFNNVGRVASAKLEKGGSVLGQDTYTYLPGGSLDNIVSQAPNISQGFTYDGLNRMASWTLTDSQGGLIRQKDWVYDDADNLISTTDTNTSTSVSDVVLPNILNQIDSYLPSIGTDTYLGNGELTQRVNGSDSEVYTWDALGRPVTCVVTVGGASKTIDWEYSADGSLRMRSDSSGNTELFHYGATGDLLEVTGTDGLKRYLHETAGGAAVLLEDAGVMQVLQTDWRGDLVRSLNENSTSATEYLVSPYGLSLDPTTGLTANVGAITPIVGGQRPDRTLGLIRYGVRSYDPRVGRFISRDPLGIEGGTNLYSFAGNNPWKYSDPSGHSKKSLMKNQNFLQDLIDSEGKQDPNGFGNGILSSEKMIAIREYAYLNRNWLGLDPDKGFWDLDTPDKIRVVNLAILDTATRMDGATPGELVALEKGMDQAQVLRGKLLGVAARERELGMAIDYGIAAGMLALDVMDLPSTALEAGLKYAGVPEEYAAGAAFAVGLLQGGRSLWGRGAREGLEAGARQLGRRVPKTGCFVAGTPVWKADGSTMPIESLSIGDSVLTMPDKATEVFVELTGLSPLELNPQRRIIPEQWREVHLSMVDGSMDAVLLRPLSWIAQERAEIDQEVNLFIAGFGLHGSALVTAIRDCPENVSRSSSDSIITGTFARPEIKTVELSLKGLDKPIVTTAEHPFWSESIGAWTGAGDLEPGERILGKGDSSTVLGSELTGYSDRVYNLEVGFGGTYAVSLSGVWVHNSCPKLNRKEALREAKDRAGVPRSQQPKRQWTVGNDPTRRGHKNYHYTEDTGSHGRMYEYDTPNGSRVVAEHTADANRATRHVHAGQPKHGSTRRGVDYKDERYQQVGGRHHIDYRN